MPIDMRRKQNAGDFINKNKYSDVNLDLFKSEPRSNFEPSKPSGGGGSGVSPPEVKDPVTRFLMDTGETLSTGVDKFLNLFGIGDEGDSEKIEDNRGVVPIKNRTVVNSKKEDPFEKTAQKVIEDVRSPRSGVRKATVKRGNNELSVEGSTPIEEMQASATPGPILPDTSTKEEAIKSIAGTGEGSQVPIEMSKLNSSSFLDNQRDQSTLSKVGDFVTSPNFRNFLATTAATLDPENKGADILRGNIQNEVMGNYMKALRDPNKDATQIEGYNLLTPEMRLKAKQDIRSDMQTRDRSQYLEALAEQARATAAGILPAGEKLKQQEWENFAKQREINLKALDRNAPGVYFNKETGDWIINPGVVSANKSKASDKPNQVSASTRSQINEMVGSEFLNIAKENYIAQRVKNQDMDDKEIAELRNSLDMIELMRQNGDGENFNLSFLRKYLPPEDDRRLLRNLQRAERNVAAGAPVASQGGSAKEYYAGLPEHGTIVPRKDKDGVMKNHRFDITTKSWFPIE